MSLLRIALGYPAKSRRSVPVVMAVGYSAKDIQAAVDAAPASVLRIETGWFHFHRLGKRGAGAVPATEPEEPSEGEQVELPTDSVEGLAGYLYGAYCDAVGGKAFNGDPLPDWDAFRGDEKKKQQSAAWVSLSELVLRQLSGPELVVSLESAQKEIVKQRELMEERSQIIAEREKELAAVRERLAALEKQFESAVPKTPAGVGDEKSSAPAPAVGRKAAKDGGAARDGAAKGPKESDLSGEE